MPQTFKLAVLTDRPGQFYLTNNLRRALRQARQYRNAGLPADVYAGEFEDREFFCQQYGQREQLRTL